jgi:hypothetical protein
MLRDSCSPERNNINILSLDDAIIQSILSELEPRDLARAAQVSRAFYLFCYDDDLWKPLCFSAFQEQTTFRFRGTWRETFISEKFPAQFVPSEPIRVQGFYSDVLYHSHIGATQSFERYARVDNIESARYLYCSASSAFCFFFFLKCELDSMRFLPLLALFLFTQKFVFTGNRLIRSTNLVQDAPRKS